MPTTSAPGRGSRISTAFEGSGARRTALLALLLLAAALLVVGRRYEPAAVAGVAVYAALLAGVVEVLLRASRAFRSRPLRVARAALPPVVLIAVTVSLLWPAWSGARRMFLEQDHPTHLAGARYFLEQLGRGRFWQFSQLWDGGDAISDLYGWGGNLYVAAIRLVSFGALSLERAYQCAVASTFTACSLVMYALARRFSRRSIALGLALLPVNQLYWRWPLVFGTWHSQLATVLVLYGCARAIDAARRGRRRDALVGAACIGVAGVMHSFAVLATLFVGGSLVASAVLAGRGYRRRAWLAAVPVVLGLGVAAFWIVPMTRGLATFAVHWPWRGEEDPALFGKVLGASTLNGVFFSAAAVLAATLHRDPMLRGLAFALVAGTLFQRVGFEAELRLADAGFGASMQWFRTDAFLVLAAPAAMAALLEAALRRRRRPPLAWERIVGLAVALTALALALPFFAQAFRAEAIALRTHRPMRVRTDPPSLDRLIDALAERRARDATWPFRVLWTADPNIQEVPLTALRARVPIMTLPGLPALTNQNRLRVPTSEALRAWGVRYVVSDRATPPAPEFVADAVIGPYHLFRDEGYRGLATSPAGVQVAVTKFEDDEVRLRVQGAPADGAELRLAIAWYPRFRATEDGRAIELHPLPEAPGAPPMLVGLRARDGEIVLRPDRALPGTGLGFFVTALAIAGLVVVARAGRSPRLDPLLARLRDRLEVTRERLAEKASLERASWRSVLLVGGGASLLALLAVVGLGRALARSPLPRGFLGDRSVVTRTELDGSRPQRCDESLALRQWLCDGGALEDGVARVQLATAMDPPAPGESWSFGRPFTALRVEEHQGRGVLHVAVRGFEAGRFLHVRMEGVGPMPSAMTASRGGAPIAVPIVHGWSTVALDGADADAIDFALRFEAPGGLAFRATVDDDATNPKTAQVP